MAASPINYTAYTEKDFINDPFFQNWILHPDEESNTFWSQFAANRPSQKKDLEAAAAFLKNLVFREDTLSDERASQLFGEHLTRVEFSEQKFRTPVRHLFKKAIAVAALVAGVMAGLYFIIAQNRQTGDHQLVIVTPYGSKKELRLPDSSFVMLNAHSGIKYNALWKAGTPREIWLEGEAFFDIKHLNRDKQNIKAGERFIVYGKHFTIEVLGTAFNIRQRRERTEIVLQRGSIKLTLNDKDHTHFIMKPGELVTYNEANGLVNRSFTEPQEYAAWKENRLLLADPRLEEIAGYLEDNYGKRIRISDPALAAKKIEGPILLTNLDDALFIISTVLKTTIEKRDNAIVIRPK